MTTLNPSPPQADLIRRTFRLAQTEPLPALTLIEGGITNTSYRFRCRGEDYLLRQPGEDAGGYILRDQEAASYRAILPLGLCDEVLALEPETGLKITRFWEGVRPADPRNPDDVRRCMAALHRIHDYKARVPHRHDEVRLCRLFEAWMPKPSVYPAHREVQQCCLDMVPILERYEQQNAVLCHCDTVTANFLFFPRDGREEMRVIDWEYSGMADPAIDLAMFADDASYTPSETDALIRCYLGEEPDPEFTLRVYGNLALTAITWSNWEEYIRAAGSDYGDYGQKQFRNAGLFSRLFWELLPRVESEAGHGQN